VNGQNPAHGLGPSGVAACGTGAWLGPSGRPAQAVPGRTHDALSALVTARVVCRWHGH
jgi:hypothetical protein